MNNNLDELYEKHKNSETVERFGRGLSEFIAKQFSHYSVINVVEIGLGVSTLCLLKNVPNIKLYTIDPFPWFSDVIEHPNFEWIKDYSDQALLPLYNRIGSFDWLQVDGNHDVRCVTYDYEFGFACLKPNCFISADDTTWNTHNAWYNFCVLHNLKPFQIGSLGVIKKGFTDLPIQNMEAFDKMCKDLASGAEKTFLESGGKNSEIHEQWQKIRDGK